MFNLNYKKYQYLAELCAHPLKRREPLLPPAVIFALPSLIGEIKPFSKCPPPLSENYIVVVSYN